MGVLYSCHREPQFICHLCITVNTYHTQDNSLSAIIPPSLFLANFRQYIYRCVVHTSLLPPLQVYQVTIVIEVVISPDPAHPPTVTLQYPHSHMIHTWRHHSITWVSNYPSGCCLLYVALTTEAAVIRLTIHFKIGLFISSYDWPLRINHWLNFHSWVALTTE